MLLHTSTSGHSSSPPASSPSLLSCPSSGALHIFLRFCGRGPKGIALQLHWFNYPQPSYGQGLLLHDYYHLHPGHRCDRLLALRDVQNKPLCVTIDGVKSCATSNLSTGQKIGYTAFAVVQWLIDLCEYRFTLSSLHALSASRELPPRDARALTARAYLDVVAPFKPISPDMLLSHVMVWTAMLISPFPLRHRCHHPPLRRAAR